MQYSVKLLNMEHRLQVNSVKYLLTLLVCRCSIFRCFLPSKCTMLLIVAISLSKTQQFFFLPQWFISLMSKCPCLQFSSNAKLNHPIMCSHGVWELLLCMEATAKLWGGGCSHVHTPHFQNCSCGKGNCFVLSCSSVTTKFRGLLSSLQGFFLIFAFEWSHVNRSTWFKDPLSVSKCICYIKMLVFLADYWVNKTVTINREWRTIFTSAHSRTEKRGKNRQNKKGQWCLLSVEESVISNWLFLMQLAFSKVFSSLAIY